MAGAATDLAAPALRGSRPALRVLGTSVTQIPAIQQAAAEDLGLALDFITLDGTEAQRQGALRPQSFDVYDQWFHDIDLIWPAGSIQPLETRRIARWEEINAIPRTGRLSPDQPRARGGDPSRRLFVQLDGTLGDAESGRISMVPTVHNADSFAVVGADPASVESWGALLDPEWAGRVVLQADAAIGSLDMVLALQAQGQMQPEDPGDLTLEEIDALVDRLRALRAAGHFRCFWTDEAEAIAAMREGGPMIGSLWWSGVTRLRAEGVPVAMTTPREGYRGWFGGLGLSVLAVPVGAMGAVAAEIAPHLKAGAVITDVGSVKRDVIATVAPHLPDGVAFIPGHPLAGTEHSGPRSGFAELFENRYVLLTPTEGTDPVQVERLAALWRGCGANVETMDADRHDLVLAVTSHAPHLIAYTMVGVADDLRRVTDSEVIKYSAAGFRDFTRIAASDPVMWRDVFLTNKDATLEILGRFTEELFALQRAIRTGDGDQLQDYFTRTRAIRRGIVEAGQDTAAPNFGRGVPKPEDGA